MTKDEKIDKILNSYGQAFKGAFGEIYGMALGEFPTDNIELNKVLRDVDQLRDAMVTRGLLSPQRDHYPNGIFFKISEFGQDIVDNGGWLNYLVNAQIDDNENKIKADLELENIKLQNETLRSEISKRDKKEEIDKLTIENLRLQNRNNRISFLIIGGLVGFILANLKWILELFGFIETK